jgi:hypothetical protein
LIQSSVNVPDVTAVDKRGTKPSEKDLASDGVAMSSSGTQTQRGSAGASRRADATAAATIPAANNGSTIRKSARWGSSPDARDTSAAMA